jgi:hypothetical protein
VYHHEFLVLSLDGSSGKEFVKTDITHALFVHDQEVLVEGTEKAFDC